MHITFRLLLLTIAVATAAGTARACDLCGCYTPQMEAMAPADDQSVFGRPPAIGHPRTWLDRAYFAIAEQFTHFGTLQLDGNEVSNPTGQYEDSSNTQLVAGYGFTSRFAMQLNVPLLYRSFERPEGFTIDRGSESGLGDVSLLAQFVLFRTESESSRSVKSADAKSPQVEARGPDFTGSVLLIGGVKFPTGDSSRLKEEFDEVEVPGAPESGIHGHDLTLGTGSYDAIMGVQGSLRYKSFFLATEAQFTLRGDGAHQYHFANDLSWSGGPGYYVVLKRNAIVGIQAVVSGEYKDLDRFRGDAAEDTGITSVLLGPRVIASVGKISGELALDLPVSINNTALQAVPDYRVHASLAIRF